MILFCHVILLDHVIKGSWAGAHQVKLPCYKDSDHKHCSSGYITILVSFDVAKIRDEKVI